MTTTVPGWAAEVVATIRYPVVFATVSGAHMYGFASADSDLDLRGVHQLPLPELVGLRTTLLVADAVLTVAPVVLYGALRHLRDVEDVAPS